MLAWEEMLAAFAPRFRRDVARDMFPKFVPLVDSIEAGWQQFSSLQRFEKRLFWVCSSSGAAGPRTMEERFGCPPGSEPRIARRPSQGLVYLLEAVKDREPLYPAYNRWQPDPSGIALDAWVEDFFMFRQYRRFRGSVDKRAVAGLFWGLFGANNVFRPTKASRSVSWALRDYDRWVQPGTKISPGVFSVLCHVFTDPREFRAFLSHLRFPTQAPVVLERFVKHGVHPCSANQFIDFCLLADAVLPQKDSQSLVEELGGPRNDLASLLSTQHIIPSHLRPLVIDKAFSGEFGPVDDVRLLSHVFSKEADFLAEPNRFSGELLRKWLTLLSDEDIAVWLSSCSSQQFLVALSVSSRRQKYRLSRLALGALPAGARIFVDCTESRFLAPAFVEVAREYVEENLLPGVSRDFFFSLSRSHPGTLHSAVDTVKAAVG